MAKNKISALNIIQYKFDNLMSKGGISILTGLLMLIVVSLCFLVLLRVAVSTIMPDQTVAGVPDMLWRSFTQITDAGSLESDENSNYLNKFMGIVTILIGLVFFSALIAFINNWFLAKMISLRKGKSAVIERGHTLILGFGIQVIEIIEQLLIANKSQKKNIVVLAKTDKVKMDDILSEAIKSRRRSRITTRSGDISNTKFIKNMSVSNAQSIIILNEASVADLPVVRNKGDAKVLEAIIAVVTSTADDYLPPVVAQLHASKTSKLAENIAPGKITVIDTNNILARILVYTSLNHGLAFVYSHLVGFSGDGIFIKKMKHGWMNHSFGKLQFHFIRSILLGFRTPAGNIILNPQADYLPDNHDEGIFLAESYAAIRYYRKQVITPVGQKFFMKKSSIILEKQLVVGWNSKIRVIIDEYINAMRDGSAIDIVVKAPDDAMKSCIQSVQDVSKTIKVHLIDGDIHDPDFLSGFKLLEYNNIVILAEESNSVEEVDMKTISRLLEFRDYFKKLKNTDPNALVTGVAKTKLVTEVIDSEKADIFFEAGAKDFLIPHKFVSEIIAQISQQPELKQIYDEIINTWGCELYLKPVFLFFSEIPITVNFADCMLAAQVRGEICIGVKISTKGTDMNKHGLYMPADKNIVFHLHETDSLVTLSDNRN